MLTIDLDREDENRNKADENKHECPREETKTLLGAIATGFDLY